MLRRLYDWTIALSARPSAIWALGAISFAESSVFPIPPDLILIPMSLARPHRAFFYAGICTVTSVLGGLLGYAIGALLYDTVGKFRLATAIVREDRVRYHRRRRISTIPIDHYIDVIAGEHFDRAGERGFGKRVSIDAEKERPIDTLAPAIYADCLRYRDDVVLVERAVEGAAAMSRGAEGHALRRDRGVGPLAVIGGNQACYIDQHCRIGGLAR